MVSRFGFGVEHCSVDSTTRVPSSSMINSPMLTAAVFAFGVHSTGGTAATSVTGFVSDFIPAPPDVGEGGNFDARGSCDSAVCSVSPFFGETLTLRADRSGKSLSFSSGVPKR